MDSDNTALTFALVDEPMDPHATQDAESPRGPLRFSYATGSRPLDGFTIKRGIGHGGFGEVYFAISDGGKEVAIKLIRRNLDVELRGVMQCLNLKHPNLIALFDVKQDDQGNSWVVMEYATGESLEEVIGRSPDGMPVDEALDWFHGIAAGVAYLHDHGIVHRDLKPGNIFPTKGWSRSATTACRSSSRAAAAADRPKASAPSTTWRPKWPTAATARKSTSTPWASSFTRCSPAACRSRAKASARC